MPSNARLPLLTSRDVEVLAALDRCPLTAAQLLKCSACFALPFTDERRVRERLQVLCGCGRVRRWRYATAGEGALGYYTLSRLGYLLLHGEDAPPPARRAFSEVGIARQHHTFSLAEFVVHTAVAAHRAGLTLTGFYRENTFSLRVGEECLFPDCGFQLIAPTTQEYNFFVELDNGTERIRSERDLDSWQRKIRLYDACADPSRRFRVLVVTTRSAERLAHILQAAADMVSNPRRTIFYGITLQDYLAQHGAVTARCFRDPRGRRVALAAHAAGSQSPSTTEVRPSPGQAVCYAGGPAHASAPAA